MKVAYVDLQDGNTEIPAEIYIIGNSLLFEVNGKQHRIILTVEQWNFLADAARDRVKYAHASTVRRNSKR